MTGRRAIVAGLRHAGAHASHDDIATAILAQLREAGVHLVTTPRWHVTRDETSEHHRLSVTVDDDAILEASGAVSEHQHEYGFLTDERMIRQVGEALVRHLSA